MLNRVLRLTQPNHPSALELCQEPLLPPKADEVRVRITSIGLNRADLLFQQGRYFQHPVPNTRLGFEGGGLVDAAGPDSTFQVGDLVSTCPMAIDVETQGCLADYATFRSSQLLSAPPSLHHDHLGAIWMAYLTAWGGLFEVGKLHTGQTVVITAASSSVGIAAIQLAKRQQAQVIATTSSTRKFSALEQLGADLAIAQPRNPEDYQHYVEKVRNHSDGQGSDLVFDAVAGPASHALIKASKRGGRVVIHGLLDRRPMDVHAGVLMKRLLTLSGYTLDQTLNNSQLKQQAVSDISNGLQQRSLQPVIAKGFCLNDYQQAFDYLASNQQLGKVIITP